MKKPTPNLPTAVTDDMIKEIVVGAMRDLITQHRLSFDEAGSALASLVCAPAEVS